MTTRLRIQALSRRGSILSSTSPPPRHRSPVALPQVRKDRPSPPKPWVQRRTGSVDTSCTTAASLRHSLLSSKDTPLQNKAPLVPFPGVGASCFEDRNVIATPSSIGEPPDLHEILLDASLDFYIAAELSHVPVPPRRRFHCPTPAPILSITPDIGEERKRAAVVHTPKPVPVKVLSRTKAAANTKARGLRLPAVTSPLRLQAGSPLPGRKNATPTPLRARTVMRQREETQRDTRRKGERRSPMPVR